MSNIFLLPGPFVKSTQWVQLTGVSPNIILSDTPTAGLLQLTGDTSFTSTGYATGRFYDVFLTANASGVLTFPSWTWLGGAPSVLLSGKHMQVSLISTNNTVGSVFAAYGVEL